MVDDNYTELSTEVTTINNYKTSVSLAEILATDAYADLQSFKIAPVTALNSAYDTVDGKVLSSLSNLTDYARPVTAADANNTTADGDYIQIKFWLYSQSNITKNIGLAETIAITANDTNLELAEIENAVRLAVWSGTSNAYIFGNDADFGFEFKDGEEGYSSSAVSSPSDSDFNDLFNRTTALIDASDGTGILTDEVTGYDRVITLADESVTPTTLFTIAPLTPTLVTVNIYVEGWDSHTLNSVISASFNIVLGFRFLD
jgi:hypothetical protein